MLMDKRPYKIVDGSGRNRCGIIASSLGELIAKAQEKFGIPYPVRVLLECDGTLVDDEGYFDTREPDTCFRILREDENWLPSAENTTQCAPKKAPIEYEPTQDDVRIPTNKQQQQQQQLNVEFKQQPLSDSVRCYNCNNYHYNH